MRSRSIVLLSPGRELIRQEVDTPVLVRSGGQGWQEGELSAASDADGEPFLTTEPQHPFVVHAPPLASQQDPESTIAVPGTGQSQLAEPAAQRDRRIAAGRIAVTAPGHPEGPTRPPLAHLVDLLEVADQHASRGGPQPFFRSTSWSICLSRLSSACPGSVPRPSV